MYNKRETGARQEQRACHYLEQNGMQIVEQNFRCRQGEIDIIAKDGTTYVFVEVKYRRDARNGYPAEAVNAHKQWVISRVADYYRMKHKLWENASFRFDVVGITEAGITWYKNAFEYQG